MELSPEARQPTMVQSNSMVQLLNNRTNIVITNEEGLADGAWNKKNALYSVMFSN
jgi:hypothetical protein